MRGRGHGTAFVMAAMALGLALSLAGCTGAGSRSVTVTEADNGSTIELATGDSLKIELESNPTTGFDWYLQGALPSQLSTASDDFVQGETAGTVGAGGVRKLVYTATSAGSGDLTLGYQRAWETGVAPQKLLAITVVVK